MLPLKEGSLVRIWDSFGLSTNIQDASVLKYHGMLAYIIRKAREDDLQLGDMPPSIASIYMVRVVQDGPDMPFVAFHRQHLIPLGAESTVLNPIQEKKVLDF